MVMHGNDVDGDIDRFRRNLREKRKKKKKGGGEKGNGARNV